MHNSIFYNIREEIDNMKNKIINIFLIIIFIFCFILPSCEAIDDKPEKSSLERIFLSNSNPEKVLLDLDIFGTTYGHELLWMANTTGTNYEESAVVYKDGIAYIGSCGTHGAGHDKIFAVDVTNGEILWSYPTGPGYVGPVIDGDFIYIGTDYHTSAPADVYAFNRYNGDLIWSKTIPGGIAESIQFDDKKIYFCSSEQYTTIYALNKIDGSINWTYDVDLYYSANKPMLKDNAFYATYYSPGGKLYKLNATDGSEIWTTVLSAGPWDNSITADGQGRLFLAIYFDYTMNAYSEFDGSLLWSYTLHGPPLSFNAYHNNVVYISDTAGYVYAFDSASGNLIWENRIGDTIDISSPTISGGLIFVGTRDFDDGAFFALDMLTGDIVWKYTIGSSVTAPPSIADGMMFCGSDGWYMYAFDIGVGSGDWTLHRYDSWNTAYSPDGLTTWQYVKADCTNSGNTTNCVVTNIYDHIVENINLRLDFNANWYDSLGNLLKADSDFYVIDNLSSLESLTIVIIKNPHGNLPPGEPLIEGLINGVVDKTYLYDFLTVDPNGDDVYYYVDWGDDTNSGWVGPYDSDEYIHLSHKWTIKGTYLIKCKAKDVYGAEGPWGELEVTMPVNKPIYNYPLLELFKERFPLIYHILSRLAGVLTE